MRSTPAQLRSLGIGETLDAGIKVYRNKFATMLKAVAVVIVPVQVLNVLITLSLPDTSTTAGTTTTTSGSSSSDVSRSAPAPAPTPQPTSRRASDPRSSARPTDGIPRASWREWSRPNQRGDSPPPGYYARRS